MSNLGVALLITLIGMGLVFGTIILFWAAMTLLVRFLGAEPDTVSPATDSGAAPDAALKQRAALVAVAVALSLEDGTQARPFPLPPPVLMNSWQSVLRARQLSQRGSVR